MRKRNKIFQILSSATALLLLGIFSAPVCFAYSPPPPVTKIATLDELQQWYNTPGNGLALMTRDIDVNKLIELKPTNGSKGIQSYNWADGNGYTLRVLQGATLVVENPKLELGGEKQIVTVESGGTLVLRQGVIFAGKGEGETAVVVHSGGKINKASGFQLVGNIQDENLVPPPENSESPDTRIPINSLFDDKAHISCAVGERPDSAQYLATLYAYFGNAERAELPVEWELSAVNFEKAGTYSVTGRLTQQGLDKNNLSNPKNLTACMTITVYKKGALSGVRGEVLSVGAKGNTNARLILPALPTEQLTAVYLYTSANGVTWKKAAYASHSNGTVKDESFLSAVSTVGSHSYLVYKYITDYRPLWAKVELVGSDRAGISNTFRLTLPAGTRPGSITENDSAEDAGDSGGNRGGGGQTEETRKIPENTGDTPKSSNSGARQGIVNGLDDPLPAAELAERGTPAARPSEQPDSDEAAEDKTSLKAAAPLAGEREKIPPERGQKKAPPPAVAVAVVIAGGAGLAGWRLLKRKWRRSASKQ